MSDEKRNYLDIGKLNFLSIRNSEVGTKSLVNMKANRIKCLEIEHLKTQKKYNIMIDKERNLKMQRQENKISKRDLKETMSRIRSVSPKQDISFIVSKKVKEELLHHKRKESLEIYRLKERIKQKISQDRELSYQEKKLKNERIRMEESERRSKLKSMQSERIEECRREIQKEKSQSQKRQKSLELRIRSLERQENQLLKKIDTTSKFSLRKLNAIRTIDKRESNS